MMRWTLILLIRIYRVIVSPVLGNCCRFSPSCSTYMIEAIQAHGCFKGLWLGSTRLLRCHPFHSGGIDPVPEPRVRTTVAHE